MVVKFDPESEYAGQQLSMLTKLREIGGLDEKVLRALESVPRHRFVSPLLRDQAYADHPVSIGHGQTISQPWIVASMLQHAAPKSEDKALEVGGGSGYMAALLSLTCDRVVAVERVPQLAELAVKNLHDVGITNVEIVCGDGSIGWLARAPYDVIIVSAAVPTVPGQLTAQLNDGGRMVVPVGCLEEQVLMSVVKNGNENNTRALYKCKFVPLLGKFGFQR